LARTTHTGAAPATGSCGIFLTFLMEKGDEIMEIIEHLFNTVIICEVN